MKKLLKGIKKKLGYFTLKPGRDFRFARKAAIGAGLLGVASLGFKNLDLRHQLKQAKNEIEVLNKLKK